jgi:hypothetical protein
LILMHGIFKRARKAYGLPVNPAAEVEPLTLRSPSHPLGTGPRGG